MRAVVNKVSSFSKRTVVALFVLCAAVIVAVTYNLIETDDDRLAEDVKLISEEKTPVNYISKFDLICFTYTNAAAKEELRREAARFQANFSHSLETCGVNGSCCNLSSDVATIGLVKNNQILCLQIHKFDYWLDKSAPLCMSPSRLRVEKITSEPGEPAAGGGSFTPGRTACRILEER